MTVGLLGGTFDPPHLGHLALAEQAIDRLGLELLVVVPAGTPPHKPVETDAETRFRLAEAAFAGRPRVELSRRELEREGPSYTVDTVRWAAERWGDVLFLVGADQWADFQSWHDPEGVLKWAKLAVATRSGYVPEVPAAHGDRVVFFEIDSPPISSREIRERVEAGRPIDGLVPARVAELIEELGLYRRYTST